MSIPRNPATRTPAEGRGSGGSTADDDEPKRGNRAQLIVGGAVALVLIGTTAFVLLREGPSTPPETPTTVQPAPAAAPAPPPPAPSAPVAAAPPVAPPPAPVATEPAEPPAVAPPAPEPPQAEAKPAAKHHHPTAATERQAAEPPAVEHPPAEHPTGSVVYTLQLNSFLVPENATALIARINEHGGSAYDKPETGDDGKTWHKVRVGAYNSPAEAEAAAEDLKKTDGIDALIVRTTAEEAK